MSQHDNYRFQVNLGGMIDILSNHLYSSPKVYLRELLQNAVDAVTARRENEPLAEGSIKIDVTGAGGPATLTIQDNGIGLTEENIHEFLAVIGQSSKRSGDLLAQPTSFIGRFGIGLLSCFMVSDEIVVLTQSAKGGPSLEWRGKPDGTYSIRKLDTELTPGTRVFLRCKPGSEAYFEQEFLESSIYYYGALLPYPITLQTEQGFKQINEALPIWIKHPDMARSHKAEVLAWGERLLGDRFKDFIPLQTASGRTGGIAYILPQGVNLNAKRAHRVYLKNMLVSEKAENILPEWAFFVKCLIWSDELQLTASREHFYENDQLEEVRGELGEAIRSELMTMAELAPDRLQAIIGSHALSMKALAVEDEQFYRIIYRWLPFHSSIGQRELGELLQEHKHLYYTLTLDEYRQITHVAAAQSLVVVNGGYIYDYELMSRLPLVHNGAEVERLLPEDVSFTFTDLTAEERRNYYEATREADAVLQEFRTQVQLKRFKPSELPALYTLSKESSDLRSLELTREAATDLFSSVLGNLSAGLQNAGYATLYLNLDNPVISRLFQSGKNAILPIAIKMLYVNALMMGHYPMNRQELSVLNSGIIQFIDWGLSSKDHNGGTTV
ncbi:HSP90 family protein [Paenibacillus oryzae]|uniref:HSP90 family protein n=1 Tax=Paenibacillus oryzae TaxID=1844972 RepID=A0A1A5YK40_9BACL|nr:HSP90 family protein [Paenibacillus oryzae]OBR65928.1 HSP90 family protein [Paenibacillus oryzae]